MTITQPSQKDNTSEEAKTIEIDLPEGEDFPSATAMLQEAYYRERHTGPIPHPSTLKGYDDVVPGSGREIIDVFRNEAAHQIALGERGMALEERSMALAERESIEASRRADWGVIASFVISMTVIVLGIILVFLGYPVHGTSLVVVNIAAIVSAFIYGTHMQAKERSEDNPKE